jgi:hypothetical protein
MTTYLLKLFDINCLSLEKIYDPNDYVIVIPLSLTKLLSDLTLNMSNTLGVL